MDVFAFLAGYRAMCAEETDDINLYPEGRNTDYELYLKENDSEDSYSTNS